MGDKDEKMENVNDKRISHDNILWWIYRSLAEDEGEDTDIKS